MTWELFIEKIRQSLSSDSIWESLNQLPEQIRQKFEDCNSNLPMIRPSNSEEVMAVIQTAKKYQQSFSVPGQFYFINSADHLDSNFLLSLDRMNSILGYDSETQILHCEPSVSLTDFSNGVFQNSCWFPITPGDFRNSEATLAQWIILGGFGSGSLRFGNILKHLAYLKIITPDGQEMLLDSSKDKQQLQIIVGSLGTAAIITGIGFKCRSSLMKKMEITIPVASISEAMTFYQDILSSNLTPGSFRFLDRDFSLYFNHRKFLKLDSTAVVIELCGTDYSRQLLELKKLIEVFNRQIIEEEPDSFFSTGFLSMLDECQRGYFSVYSAVFPVDKVENAIVKLEDSSRILNTHLLKWVEWISSKTAMVTVGIYHGNSANVSLFNRNLLKKELEDLLFRLGGLPAGPAVELENYPQYYQNLSNFQERYNSERLYCRTRKGILYYLIPSFLRKKMLTRFDGLNPGVNVSEDDSC